MTDAFSNTVKDGTEPMFLISFLNLPFIFSCQFYWLPRQPRSDDVNQNVHYLCREITGAQNGKYSY